MISVLYGTDDIADAMISASQMIYASRMKGTDIISCLRSKYIIRQSHISYRVSDISLKSTTKYDIILMMEGEWMKDKRINKVKQHFDMFFNNQKFKVISCEIDEANSIISIKTKVFGQPFPHNGCFTIFIPSQDTMQDLSVVFRSMSKDSSIEHWEYTIKTE